MLTVRKSSPGKRVVVRQNASQVVEESQHRLCSRMTVGALPDDVLLEIFDFYLAIHYWDYHGEDSWHRLVHVCKRWRSIVFASPRRLRLRLLCTDKRPMQKTLEVWPALPIVIRGQGGISRAQGANDIIAALELHNRVCEINFDNIPNTLLEQVLAMMKDPLPVLTSVVLCHRSQNINAPPLPGSFLGGSAPRLQTLTLVGIPFPALPKLLSSTHDLVTLSLWDIPLSGYISPDTIVTGLSALTRLQKLVLWFRCPRSRVDRENQLRPHLTRTILPALTSFYFRGDSEYMEDVLGQIDTPLLHQFNITFFNQLVFSTPLLRDFIGRTQALKTLHTANVEITEIYVRVRACRRNESNNTPLLSLDISCRPSDRQLSSLAQLCNSALSHILTLERLEIIGFRGRWKDDTENAQWLEVLHPFTSVKDLILAWALVPVVAPALEDLAGEGVTEVLPSLQNLFLQLPQPSDPVRIRKSIGKFISARQLSGRPVTVHHRECSDQVYVLWEVGDR